MRSAVPGKARVHELAKELGVDSKTVLAKLKEMGEFVKSASSTVEAPVARRLRGGPEASNGKARPAAPAAPGGPAPPPQVAGPPPSAPSSPAAPSPGAIARPKPPAGRPGPTPGPVSKPASAHDIE